MRIAAIAFCAVLCASNAARADWQYTKWGMTEGQLTAVSSNIIPTTADETKKHSNPYIGESKLKSGYNAGDLSFTAFYWFRSGKLVAVELVPSSLKDAPRINLMLEKIYGAPIKDDSQNMSGGKMYCSIASKEWRDEKEANQVRFSSMTCNTNSQSDFASVRYEPLLSTKGTGL